MVTHLNSAARPERSPADFPDSPLARVLRQPMLLGLFLPIQNGGWSPSLVDRTTTWTFDYNAALTLQAEALDFDLVFGLAQWLGINELSDAESNSVLAFLYAHSTKPAFQVRFRWQPHSIAFWDNRAVQHIAMWDYFPQVRSGSRVTVQGDRPV